MRVLAIPKAGTRSLISLRETQDRGQVVSHGRYETFEMAEVVVPRQMFGEFLSLIAGLRAAGRLSMRAAEVGRYRRQRQGAS